MIAMAPLAAASKDVHYVFVTGESYYENTSREIREAAPGSANSIHVLPYLHNMPEVLAASALVVGRAGASSLAELTALGLPSILIPSPNVTNNHQEANARSLADAGAAELMLERELSGEGLMALIDSILQDNARLQRMQEAARKLGMPSAAAILCRRIANTGQEITREGGAARQLSPQRPDRHRILHNRVRHLRAAGYRCLRAMGIYRGGSSGWQLECRRLPSHRERGGTPMNSWMDELEQARVGEITQQVPLSGYTTWRIGGPADVMVVPGGKEELAKTISILHRHEVPWITIGKGSNMLVSDKGFRGVVIRPEKALEYAEFQGPIVTAGAAFSFIRLSIMAGREGLTGLEFAGGIPGTVGGAVYMNAGAHGSDVSRIFKSAEIVLETGELVVWGPEEIAFSYRHSRLQEAGSRGIVLEATLELESGDRKEIAAAMATHKERRRRTQPLQQPSCGSVFRNPPGNHAAKLVEEAGLKGFSIGGAQVSTLHANFIVNTGQATAEDVLTLITHIRSTVKDRTGIDLMPEVLVVGER